MDLGGRAAFRENEMNETAAPVAKSGRVKTVVLVISLGVNLAVGGLALGAWLHGPPGVRDGRDLGFGPFDEAFRPADRMALRDAVRARAGDLKAARGQLGADVAAVIAALRAEPFDAGALTTALAAQQAHLTARLQIGSEVVGNYLAALSPADRKAFADRLEARMAKGKPGPETGPAD